MPASSTMLASRRCHTPLSHVFTSFIIITLSICPILNSLSLYLFLFHTNPCLLNHLFLALQIFFFLHFLYIVCHTYALCHIHSDTHISLLSLSCMHPHPAFSFCLAWTHSYFCFMTRMFLELHCVVISHWKTHVIWRIHFTNLLLSCSHAHIFKFLTTTMKLQDCSEWTNPSPQSRDINYFNY